MEIIEKKYDSSAIHYLQYDQLTIHYIENKNVLFSRTVVNIFLEQFLSLFPALKV